MEIPAQTRPHPSPSPKDVRAERLTVLRPEGFVVLLIGARVNRWWHLPVLWGVARAMNRMIRRLSQDPSSGLLAYESYGGRTTLMVQYWRSLEDLHRFAHDRQQDHVPAWRRWTTRWSPTGAMGVWHETYVVKPGTYECIYHHMPPFGLGRVGPLVPADGPLRRADGRLAAA